MTIMMNLVKMYLKFIIKVNCTFRAPEVIIPSYVELNKIELYSEINEKNNHINNRYGYNAMCRERVKLLTHNYNESIFKKNLDLCLDDDIVAKIDFRFVEDSCHMPMVENHEALADIIASILAE